MSDTSSPHTDMDEHEIIRNISQTRAESTRRHWRCPSVNQVAAYLDQQLAGDHKALFEAHLAKCDFCIALISALVHQRQSEEQLHVPADLVRQAINAVPEKALTKVSWRWALAPALATILVASAVWLRSPQPARIEHPDIAAAPVQKATPPTVSETRPQAPAPQVRSLPRSTVTLQLLEPRSGSTVRSEGLRIRWSSVDNADYYDVRMVNSEGALVWLAESSDSAARLPATLSVPPGDYFVWVRAQLNDGRVLKSETIAFHVRSSS